MYPFYKNTLTFNCCFSNLPLLCFSWEDAAHMLPVREGQDDHLCGAPNRETMGQRPFHPRLHQLLLIHIPLQRTSQISFGVRFEFKYYLFGEKTLCVVSSQSQPLSYLSIMVTSGIPRPIFWKISFESKAELVHVRNSSGLGWAGAPG